ncbi:MAG: peptide deformylase [Thermodesulfovibrionales bacterium]|nr:peptide deformylase [Thermodesulfovibrionales bacterium]
MAILEIKKFPDEVLKRKALPVEEIDSKLQRLIDDMIETMYAAPGIGLAAPQVGISRRLIIVDVGYRNGRSSLITIINPELTLSQDLIDSEEGCLSLPGHVVNLKRSARVIVKGLNRDGKPIELEAEGLLARALQHEIDHLDGILILDRLGPFRRELLKKKILRERRDSRL